MLAMEGDQQQLNATATQVGRERKCAAPVANIETRED